MIEQYGGNVIIYDHVSSTSVWLKWKYFKSEESKKLLLRKAEVRKLPNRVNEKD